MRADTSLRQPAPDPVRRSEPSEAAHRRLVAGSFVLSLLVHGAYVAITGVRFGMDAHLYSAWGDLLLKYRFDYGDFLAEATTIFPPVLYTGFVTLIAATKLIFGTNWAWGMIALNVVAAALTGAVLVYLALRATGSTLAAVGALGLYLASFDVAMWTPFLCSDVVFLLLTAGMLTICVRGIVDSRSGRKSLIALAALVLAAFFLRPAGIIFLPALALGVWMWISGRRRVEAATSGRRFVFAVLGSFAVMALAGTLLHAWLMQNPGRWPFAAGSTIMAFNAAHYDMGEIVRHRPETFHTAPSSLADYVWITADRFLHFFYFRLGTFSFAHNMAGAVFYVPAYALALLGSATAFWSRFPGSQSRRQIALLAVVWLLSFAVFHALAQIDFDWRYRLPIIPALLLLAALGIERLTAAAAAVTPPILARFGR